MTERNIPNLDRTRAALAEFDAGEPARMEQLDRVETNEDFAAFELVEKEAGDKVREAFWLDTQDRNRRDTIFQCMSVNGVRDMVERIGRLQDDDGGQCAPLDPFAGSGTSGMPADPRDARGRAP